MKKIVSLVLALSFAMLNTFALAQEETIEESIQNPVMLELYVSQKGSDTNDGSKNAPFLTIEKAKQTVRKNNKNMTGDIIVNIGDGIWYLDKTLTFTSEDSATNGYSIIYKGNGADNSMISGGRKLVDWKLHDEAKNIWVADAKGIKSRTLFVNGERRWRPRYPGSFKLENAPTRGNYIIQGENIFENIQNINEVEIIWTISFSDTRMPIVGLKGNELIMPKANWDYGQSYLSNPYVAENAYEWLDEGGEWYLNTPQGKVYYIPKSGEDLSKEDVVIGNLETIIDFAGTETNRVRGITFTELTLKDSTWMGPNNLEGGFPNFQAGFCREHGGVIYENMWFIAAVMMNYADDINFIRNEFRNFGGGGIWAKYSVHDVNILGNKMHDISHNGVTVAHIWPHTARTEDLLCDNIKVDHNVLYDIGIEYLGCIPLVGGYPRNTSFSYNEIYNVPYSGISLGWGWNDYLPKTPETNDESEFLNSGNRIIGNNIYNFMSKINDGGGIYTLGTTPDLLIERNYVHDAAGSKLEVLAYYNDSGTRWCTMRENVSSNVGLVLYSRGMDNKIYNNYFDANFENSSVIGDQKIGHSTHKLLPIPDGHEVKIYDNIVVRDGSFPKWIIENAGPGYEYQDFLYGIKGDTDENIAANNKATANAIKSNGKTGKFATGKGYNNAIDADNDTEMTVGGNDVWTAEIDLGIKRSLYKMRVLFGDDIPQDCKITVSADYENYIEIPLEEISQDNEILLDSTVARIVRIEAVEGKMSIAEIEIYADDFVKKIGQENKFDGITLVTFDDIQNHWARESIEYLASMNIIKGYSDELFAPEKNISRAEWLTLLTRVLGIQKSPYHNAYSDVNNYDWFADNIQAAKNNGLMNVCFSEETIEPNKPITREESAATVSQLKFTPSEESYETSLFNDIKNSLYFNSIEYVLEQAIMIGKSENAFDPNGNITRAEAAVVLERVLSRIDKE